MTKDYENLPEKLKKDGLFCLWKYQKEIRNGEETVTKVPYNPNFPEWKQNGDPSSKGRFATFTKTLQALSDYKDFYDGIAIGVFDHICGIDIDDCIDGNGAISKDAQWIIDKMKCYTEKSPSGKGIRILFLVKHGFHYDTETYYIHNKIRHIEIYVAECTKKVLTVTGDVIRPGDLTECTFELLEVAQKYMKRRQKSDDQQTNGESSLSDDAVVQKASSAKNGEKFKKLWEGDSSDYPSQSEADFALCKILAFWTNKDPEQIDALFRQSGLMREKWDSKRGDGTYGSTTIQDAIKECKSVYITKGKEQKTLKWDKFTSISKKDVSWLITGYIPRKGITILGGDGGVGKTSVECAIAASVSAGRQTFLTENSVPDDLEENIPGRVVLLNAEDPYGEVLKPLLTAYGANEDNIFVLDEQQIKEESLSYSDAGLKNDIKAIKPDLIIFDPIQQFLPERVRMSERNAMRREVNHALAMAVENDCAVLIVMHTNKQQKVWGRQRLSDSSDIWDIARSVLMAGISEFDGTRHLTHEKSNFGKLQESIVYQFDDDRRITVIERNTKRDRDYILEAAEGRRTGTTAAEEAEDHIIELLSSDGEMRVDELDEAICELGISKRALRNAKKEMKDTGVLKYRKEGSGKGKGVQWYVSLCVPTKQTSS